MPPALNEYIPNQIWLKEYLIHYFGTTFNARMTVVRLNSGNLFIHSPCEIDRQTKIELEALGTVTFIIAPGTYHYLYVSALQQVFPQAQTFICPGLETKCPDLDYDGILSDQPEPAWASEFQQVVVRGNGLMAEVAFFHLSSKTLIVVDSVENMTDQTKDVNGWLKFWFKYIFRMWNNPKPAPEYQLGWYNRIAASQCFRKILEWDFEQVILAHGELIESAAKERLHKAWHGILSP